MMLPKTKVPELNPEEIFIINCLRYLFSAGGPPLPQVDGTRIRWVAVFETALKWNIAPMLWRAIKERSKILERLYIPDEVYKSMEAAYIKTYTVNQSNFSELVEVVRVLDTAGIPVLLLKGAHLAPFVYQDVGMRWMADIDILIRKKDLEKAHALLMEKGYEYSDMAHVVWDDLGRRTQVEDRAAALEWYKSDHMHIRYCHPTAIQCLELHWRISRSASPFSIETERLWERSRTGNLNNETVWVLSPEDLILHISLHDVYYHGLNTFGLRPCCDVAAVARRFSGQIDWDQLQRRARTWGVERYLHLMLRLSQELLGTDIPPHLSQVSRDNAGSERIFVQGVRRILGTESKPPLHAGMKHPSKIQVFDPKDGFFKKLDFFLKRIPISRRELASRYGVPAVSARAWLYFPLRLASLLLSYGRVYLPYFWYRLKQGRSQTDYTLDLWLKSPSPKHRT